LRTTTQLWDRRRRFYCSASATRKKRQRSPHKSDRSPGPDRGNVLHLIGDLEKNLAFYRDTLGLTMNRGPRGPADNPTAYIKLLPIIGPMYLASPDAMYRSAEVALAQKKFTLNRKISRT